MSGSGMRLFRGRNPTESEISSREWMGRTTMESSESVSGKAECCDVPRDIYSLVSKRPSLLPGTGTEAAPAVRFAALHH